MPFQLTLNGAASLHDVCRLIDQRCLWNISLLWGMCFLTITPNWWVTKYAPELRGRLLPTNVKYCFNYDRSNCDGMELGMCFSWANSVFPLLFNNLRREIEARQPFLHQLFIYYRKKYLLVCTYTIFWFIVSQYCY